MCFVFSFLPATVFTVLGYIVLYCATRSEKGVATFGRILTVWVFIVAAFFLLMGALITFTDACPIDALIRAIPSQ